MIRPVMQRLLVLAAAIAPLASQAHHVWLEQDADGARLYFGEFADNVRESSPGPLDKFLKPQARVLDARGEAREVAATREANGIVIAGRAGPGEALIAQEAGYPAFEKKEGDQVVSRGLWMPAARWVNSFDVQAPRLTLDVLPAGKAGVFIVTFKGRPLPQAQVEVVAESGWSRGVTTDKEGRLQVSLPWQGLYALEVRHTDQSGAERDGQRYDTASYVTTLSFRLAQGLPSPRRP